MIPHAGFGGYIVSGVITPDAIDCGATPALVGLIGCLLVELMHSWDVIHQPKRQLFKLSALLLGTLVIGELVMFTVEGW